MSTEQEVAWAVAGTSAQASAPLVSIKPEAKETITRGRLRAWGWLSALSLVDQGLTSGAGFGVNLLLARWMAPEVYGAFAVAFAGFLFVSGFHNVLLLEPMSVMGPSRYVGKLAGYFRTQIAVHVVLVGALSATLLLGGLGLWMAAPGSPLVGAVVGGGLALPFLLLAWLVRRMCYVMQRPALAIQGSTLYLGFVGAGLFALGHFGRLNSFSAFVLMGCGSLVSAGLLLGRLGFLTRRKDGETNASWRAVFAENWTYGRWLVGSTVLASVSSQTQIFLIAAFLGLNAAGALRAMQLPSLAMNQVIAAMGLLALPKISHEWGRGLTQRVLRDAFVVSCGLAIGALCFAGILWLFAGKVEHLLFGGRYAANAWLIPLLAIIPVATGFTWGYSATLRVMQRSHYEFVAYAVTAAVAVATAVAFTWRWQVSGAAASMVLGPILLAGATYLCCRKCALR